MVGLIGGALAIVLYVGLIIFQWPTPHDVEQDERLDALEEKSDVR